MRSTVCRRMGSSEFQHFITQHIREGPFDAPEQLCQSLRAEDYNERLLRWRHIPDEKLFDMGWFV